MPQFLDKIRVPVQIGQRGQSPVNGTLALSPVARQHDGPETLLDLLNAPRHVVPFVRDDGVVLLLTRRRIDWVALASALFETHARPAAWRVTREERVEVTFVDGSVATGLLQMELPDELNRATDFLNGDGDFYPLLTAGGTLLVNKARVLRTRLYEPSPSPLESSGA